MPLDSFISYSTKDKAVADRVCGALESAGKHCWIAPRDIPPGGSYAGEIVRAIAECRVMVLVFSAAANESEHVKREVERAISHRIMVIPYRAEDVKPTGDMEYFISRCQWVDAFHPPPEAALKRLVAAVEELLRSPTVVRPPAVGASAPAGAAPRPWRRSFRLDWRWVGCTVLLVSCLVLFVRFHFRHGTAPQEGQLEAAPMPPPVSLPESIKSLPAADVLAVVYQSLPPPAEPAARPAIQAAIQIRRQAKGSVGWVPLRDGDPLAPWPDEYVIAAKALTPGYLYVFQVDSSGNVQWLYPKNGKCRFSAGSNPLSAGQVATVPDRGRALSLDKVTGAEQVYFVFSASPWPKLEEALSQPRPGSSPVAGATGGSGGDGNGGILPEPLGMATRGVAEMHDMTGPTDPLATFDWGRPGEAGRALPAAGVRAAAAGSFLVVERWFRHVPAD